MPNPSDDEAATERLRCLLATFGAATRAIAGATDREALASAITEILVANGAFTMARIGAEPGGADRAFPLQSREAPAAVLNVSARVAGAFGELETGILAELALALGVAFDDIALRQSERLSAALVEEAVARTERLEAVSRVAATAAHDFGNVLMAISLFQGFVAEGLGPDHALAADVAAIGEALDRGRTIHAQLLAVGRTSPNDWEGRVDVLDVIDRLHGVLQAIAAPTTLRLEADPSGPEVAPQVRIGRRALEDAVLNLVVNARDAMSSRAGVITVTVGSALVPAGSDLALPEDRYVTVTVADDGPGMARDVLEQAVVPFYTTKEHGTGLGLPSVLRMARRAGGAVRIESEPGVGTTVTLLLPVAAAE